MKILKKAEQKNIVIEKDYYTVKEINEMLANREIFYFGDNCKTEYEPVNGWEMSDISFRIFTDDLTEVKVVLDESNFYTVVAIGKNGKTYNVTL